MFVTVHMFVSMQAVFKAESEVQQLMSAATAAAQGQQLSADEVMLISRKGSSMVGSCANCTG